MCFIRYVIRAVVILCVIVFSCNYDNSKPSVPSEDTTAVLKRYVSKSDWSVYMDAPRYHFTLAMENLQRGDYSGASKELVRGNSFLSFQATRISVVVKEIEELSNGLETGKRKNIATMDSLTTKAMDVLSNKYAMLSLDVGAVLVFKEEYDYLFDKAKTNVQKKNYREAAHEIRRAASHIRLKDALIGRFADTNLDSAGNELEELASRIGASVAVDTNEMELAFQKAKRAFDNE